MVKSLKEVLSSGKEILAKNNIDIREARLLLAFALDIEHSELIKIDTCTNEQYEKYIKCIERRINGEPFAYIVGSKEFMKLKFEVNKDVLIPREDTEILVLEAIKQEKKNILDLCTGSGCIAISLAKYINDARVDAVDISKEALKVAIRNALNNEVKVNFIESDLFENVKEKYDMIVSNPPYIKTSVIAELQQEVKNEPMKALDGGEDGLYFYDKISKEAVNFLNENGVILFEIGYDQGEEVSNMLLKYGYQNIKIIKDLSNNDRVIYAERG